MGKVSFLIGASWGDTLVDGLLPVLGYIFLVVGAVATGYSIYLGFLLAKAPDEGKRKQAKDRIFKTISGLLIIVILTTLFLNQSFRNAIFRGVTSPGDDTEYYIRNLDAKSENNRFPLSAVQAAISKSGGYQLDVVKKDYPSTKINAIVKTKDPSSKFDAAGSLITKCDDAGTYITFVTVFNDDGTIHESVDIKIVIYKDEVPEIPNTSGGSNTSGGNSKLGNVFIIPFTGAVWCTSRFGPRNAPLQYASTNHKGVDLVPKGSSKVIIAAAAGKVAKIGNDISGLGNYVVIEHKFSDVVLYTWYEHLADDAITKKSSAYNYIKEGDTVTQGQRIAIMGTTGTSTGEHLHFGISLGATGANYTTYGMRYKYSTFINPLDQAKKTTTEWGYYDSSYVYSIDSQTSGSFKTLPTKYFDSLVLNYNDYTQYKW